MRRLILIPRRDGPGIISLLPPAAKFIPPPAAMIRPPSATKMVPPPAAPPDPPKTEVHLPLGVLVVYEGMIWTPVPAPRQCPPVPAPRKCPPVPAPRKCVRVGPPEPAPPSARCSPYFPQGNFFWGGLVRLLPKRPRWGLGPRSRRRSHHGLPGSRSTMAFRVPGSVMAAQAPHSAVGHGMGAALEASCPVSVSLEASRASTPPLPSPYVIVTVRDAPIWRGGG